MTTAAADLSIHRTDRSETSPFAALRLRTFRIYLTGHAVASTGAWIQSIALDWLVLELAGSPSAVGIVMACQFLPMLLLGMHGGLIADRFPKRTVLLITQSLNAVVSATIAVLTITGAVRVEHLYVLALAGGLVFVVDNPARQVFVNEVVPAGRVRQAIALNAATFQASRLIGPAVAVVLIGSVGTGWAFAVNAASFLCPIVALLLIRPGELVPAPVHDRAPGGLRDALRHVAERPRVTATIVLVGFVGTFGLNFPIVLTAMAGSVRRWRRPLRAVQHRARDRVAGRCAGGRVGPAARDAVAGGHGGCLRRRADRGRAGSRRRAVPRAADRAWAWSTWRSRRWRTRRCRPGSTRPCGAG